MKSFYLAALLSSALVFGGNLLAPIEIRFVESITGSTAVSGLVFGFASLVLAIVSYRVARLSNRIGRHRPILVGIGVGVLYSVLYATVVNTLGLFGVKFAWAFALAATNPVLAAYVQTFLKDKNNTGRYWGYFYALQSLTGSGGALLGSYVFTVVGFSGVAYVLAGTYSLAGLIALLLPAQFSIKKEKIHQHGVLDLLQNVWRKPALRFYLASNITFSLNWGVKPFLWPLVIFAISGSDIVTGSIFATMGVVAFFFFFFAGMLADRIGPYKTLALEFVLFAITGVTMALTGNISVFWVAAAVYTIAEVLNLAQAMILTKELDEDLRSEAMALDASFDQILAFFSPMLAGVLVVWSSPATALLLFMSLYVISLVCLLYIGLRHRLLT